jgi:gluconate 2-dehydrogenase alpha chain
VWVRASGGIALAECPKAGLSVVALERGGRRSVQDIQDIHDSALRHQLSL